MRPHGYPQIKEAHRHGTWEREARSLRFLEHPDSPVVIPRPMSDDNSVSHVSSFASPQSANSRQCLSGDTSPSLATAGPGGGRRVGYFHLRVLEGKRLCSNAASSALEASAELGAATRTFLLLTRLRQEHRVSFLPRRGSLSFIF